MNAAAKPQPSPIAVAIMEIRLETIERNPANARTFPAKDSDDPGLVELAASIKAVGLLEPILVRPLPFAPGIRHGYQLVAGERRWRAMRLVEGATTIPAIVRELSDVEALEILVTENLQRKDLSPLEEARGVRALIDQAAWTAADVADRLGRSLHWVATRARLTSLSECWLAELAKPKSMITRWPAGYLVLIARLEPPVQDQLLKEQSDWWLCGEEIPERHDIEREVADLTRELRKAPWKLADAGLYPDAGACTECHKRSACHPGLFEDEDLEKPAKTDRCLDALCWAEKARRDLAVREAELREKHKDLVLVNGQDASHIGGRKDARSWWELEEVKKTAPGAIPALVVSGRGAGTVRWVSPPTARTGKFSSRPRGKDDKPTPTPMKDRRAGLERRRKVKAVEIIKAAIEAIEPYPEPIGMVGPLTAVFGTKHQRNSSQWAGYRNGAGQDLGGKPHKAWDLYESLCTDAAKVATELWHEVRPVLLERLAYQGTPTDITKLWADAKQACKILGIDAAEALREAVEALPEPKSWAVLQADGRPKGTAKIKPKKATKAKKPAAARALDETGDAGEEQDIDGHLDRLVDDLDEVLATLALLKGTNPAEVKGPGRRSREIAPQPAVPAAKVAAAKPRRHEAGPGRGSQGAEVAASASVSGGSGQQIVRLVLSAAVGDRLGLAPKGKAEISDAGHRKIRIRASNAGVAVGRQGATSRLRIDVPATRCGVTERHRSEALIHHFDEHDDLIVTLPTWWKTLDPGANPAPSPSARKASSPPSPAPGPPPVSASPTEADSKVRCQACKLRPAALQCNLCSKATCPECWHPHVKSHWDKGDATRPSCRREARG